MNYHQSPYTPFQSFLYPVLYHWILSKHRFLDKKKKSLEKVWFIQVILINRFQINLMVKVEQFYFLSNTKEMHIYLG